MWGRGGPVPILAHFCRLACRYLICANFVENCCCLRQKYQVRKFETGCEKHKVLETFIIFPVSETQLTSYPPGLDYLCRPNLLLNQGGPDSPSRPNTQPRSQTHNFQMVQFVITPWRDHSELLRVRQQFFPAQPTPPRSDDARDDVKEKRAALARVYMWLHRGACPHLVEATAYLVDACLLDEESQKWAHGHMQTPALTEGSSRATSLSYATAINL